MHFIGRLVQNSRFWGCQESAICIVDFSVQIVDFRAEKVDKRRKLRRTGSLI